MADLPSGAVGPILSALRTLPVWVLGGLALAGYAVLFMPAFGGVNPAGFRAQWGIWVWIEALTCSILAVARCVDTGVTAYRAQRRMREASRALRLVPLHHQRWWHLAKQQDDSFVSQITLDLAAANVTDRPVRLLNVSLIRPRTEGEVLHAEASLPAAGSPYHSSRHPVPPHDTVTVTVHIMVRGMLARQGRPIRATFGITDQIGNEYRLKGIIIRTFDPIPPILPLKVRLAWLVERILWRKDEEKEARLPSEWQHGGRFDEIDLILNEERRAYAAHGRREGSGV